MLLVGALASLGLSYTTEAWAASPSQSVNATSVRDNELYLKAL